MPGSGGFTVKFPLLLAGLALWAINATQMLQSQQNGRASNGSGRAAGDSIASRPSFRADLWSLPNDSLLGFVEIHAGQFLMGSDATQDSLAYDNEFWSNSRSYRRIDIPTYYLARYEVTVDQFRAFVRATSYRADQQALAGVADHPVAFVSWPDALAYTRWLEAVLKGSPTTPPELARLLADGWRVTLPTEAQWEKAARGYDGRRFPWGNQGRPDRANFGTNGTMPVGSFDCGECAYGLADMSGNVWEWTRTPYNPGPHQIELRPVDLVSDAVWVMRGGSYADAERGVRAAIRGGADPGVRRPFIGFRVALVKN